MTDTNNCTCCPEPQTVSLPIKGIGFPCSGLTVDVDLSGIGGNPTEGWEQSLEDNGWVKFPNGLIMQWGRTAVGALYTEHQLIAFSRPFPTRCLSVQVSEGTDSASTASDIARMGVAPETVTKESFRVRLSTSSQGYWFAIGF